MSSTYKVGVVFEGLDDASLSVVLGALPGAVVCEAGSLTTVTATVRAPGPAAAVSRLVKRVTKTVPPAVPVRVDQDLVSVSDIAQRAGRSRESVRLLVGAGRGPGGFPAPVGVVGDEIKVWPWSEVRDWFDKALGIDLGENGVPPLTAAVLDVGFATRRSPELASALGRGWLAR
jgi:predicted DNA-binding transcriptional regulator AlpA